MDLVKSEAKNLEIRGMHDIAFSDLPVPRVRLVHPLSKNTVLDTGKKAEVGTFFNDSAKKSYAEFNFRVLHFKKGKIVDMEDETIEYPAYFLICFHVETSRVCFFQVDKGNYWSFRSSVLPVLYNVATDQKKPIYTPVVKVVSKTATSKKNQEFLVMEFTTDVSSTPDPALSEILEGFTTEYEDFFDKGLTRSTGPLEGLEDVTDKNVG